MLSLGLIGYPLQQSLSPRMHAAALQVLDLVGEYRLYPVPPLPEGAAGLEERVNWLRSGRLDGLNVTIPHKQAVIPYLDDLTPRAQAIGAVNTIIRQADKLVGENTDAPGFLTDLERQLSSYSPAERSFDADGSAIEGRFALVLGAGGAARAVVYALLKTGWCVCLAARRLEQAQSLVASFQEPGVRLDPALDRLSAICLEGSSLAELESNIHQQGRVTGLLVNASSAGMIPEPSTSPWPAGLPLPASSFVYDLVYKPPETTLMRLARHAGLTACNGLGMLVEQAALALECWSGRSVPRRVMWAAVSGSLETAAIHYAHFSAHPREL